jgi:hypothetical protein
MKTMLKTFALSLALISALYPSAHGQVLVGRWQFEEGTETTTVNSVNSVNATLNVVGSGSAGWSSSVVKFGNYALDLTKASAGNGGYLDTMQASSSLMDAASSFSFSLWVNQKTVTAFDQTFVSVATDTTGNVVLGTVSAPLLKLETFSSGYSDYTGPGAGGGSWMAAPSTNTWYNYTVVHDAAAKNYKFYIDGALANTQTYTGTRASATGAWLIGGRDFLNGYVDDVQFYTGTLSAAQINDVIMVGNAIPEPSTWAMIIGGLGAILLIKRRTIFGR